MLFDEDEDEGVDTLGMTVLILLNNLPMTNTKKVQMELHVAHSA
jgi:hypothetical protein